MTVQAAGQLQIYWKELSPGSWAQGAWQEAGPPAGGEDLQLPKAAGEGVEEGATPLQVRL